MIHRVLKQFIKREDYKNLDRYFSSQYLKYLKLTKLNGLNCYDSTTSNKNDSGIPPVYGLA